MQIKTLIQNPDLQISLITNHGHQNKLELVLDWKIFTLAILCIAEEQGCALI